MEHRPGSDANSGTRTPGPWTHRAAQPEARRGQENLALFTTRSGTRGGRRRAGARLGAQPPAPPGTARSTARQAGDARRHRPVRVGLVSAAVPTSGRTASIRRRERADTSVGRTEGLMRRTRASHPRVQRPRKHSTSLDARCASDRLVGRPRGMMITEPTVRKPVGSGGWLLCVGASSSSSCTSC